MQNQVEAMPQSQPKFTQSETADSQSHPRPRWLLVISLVFTVTYVLVAIGSHFVISAFEEVFKSFGSSLPTLTQFLIDTQDYYFLLAFIPLGLSLDLWRREVLSRRCQSLMLGSLIGLGILLVVILPVIVVGMYLPVFQLGSVT